MKTFFIFALIHIGHVCLCLCVCVCICMSACVCVYGCVNMCLHLRMHGCAFIYVTGFAKRVLYMQLYIIRNTILKYSIHYIQECTEQLVCISPLIHSNPRPFSGWTLQWMAN